jgi:uncharacterized protein YfaS (alpha-2-macroglobulin family)
MTLRIGRGAFAAVVALSAALAVAWVVAFPAGPLARAAEAGSGAAQTGLLVTQVVPADRSVEVETDAAFVITFDRPVVPLTAVSDPASNLPNPLRISPEAEGVGEWLNTSIYTFRPTAPLAGGTAYTATVAAGLTAVDGTILAEDFVWSFVTVRPKVLWIDPSRDETQVPVDTEIRVTFNMPIASDGIEGRLTVRTAGLFGELFARDVDGTIEIDGATVVFTSDESLEFDRKYVVEVDAGITGAAGGLGTAEPTRWEFRTVPLPRIVRTDPKDGRRDAYAYTSFVLYFNTAIDPDTVLDNVEIDPQPEPGAIDGWYRSWDHAYVISFGARPSSAYTFRIGPHIADRFGNETGQTLVVRFETAPLDPVAWLHVPGRTCTLATSEPSRVVVGHRNTSQLSLRLWELSLSEYFEAVDGWYDYEPGGRPVRSWSLAVESPLNDVVYPPVDLVEGGGALDAGIYVIDLDARGVDDDPWSQRLLLIASAVNLTLKSSEDEVLAWATDLATGEPMRGLVLWAYDADGKTVDASVTDSLGLATLASGVLVDWRGLTVVGRDPFVLVDQDWDDGISIWDLDLPYETPPDARAYLDTDRPIYRPDQTVFFRGILRNEDDVAYRVPDLHSVDVVVRDSEWQILFEETLTLDRYGVFSGSVALPVDAALGEYTIQARAGDRTFYHGFQVAAYRAPEFEVEVTTQTAEAVRGDAIPTVVEVTYFFGAPLADAPVEWNVLSEGFTFAPDAFARYTFSDVDDPWICWWCWWIPASAPEPILDGEGTTDSEGRLLFDLPENIASLSADPADDPPTGSRRLTIEATVDGPSGEAVSGRANVIVHRADYYVGLAASRSIGRAGEAFAVDAVTVDWTAARVGEVPLRYTVYRREWTNVYEEDETGGGRWTWTKEDIEVAAGTLLTDERGDGEFAFVPAEGGTFKVVVEGDDAGGRTARTSLFLWVSGPESVSWRRTNDDTIQLVSDRTTYAVGDVAEILVPSPFEGEQWALVTVERGGILSRQVVMLPSNSSVIEVPIDEAYVPNVYVGVVLIQGREAASAAANGGPVTSGIKVGYVALSVDTSPKELAIELRPSSDRLEPGNTLGIDLRVTDADGLPVSASFSLDAVDKAVLSLQPRTAGEILSAFYDPRGLGVRTASGLSVSLSRLVLEQLEDLDRYVDDKTAVESAVGGAAPMMVLSEEAPRAAMPAAAEQLPEGITVREEFLDTAFWDPSVITDANGLAHVEFDVPDNLTTWVIRSVGVSRETLVGEETTEVLVTKPLLVRPATPRFFVVGDRARLAASVSNQTDGDLSVEATVGATGVELEDPATQTVLVPAGSEVRVAWWANVLDVESVDLAFSVVSGDLSDAARPRLSLGPDGTLPVLHYTAVETVGTAGQLSEEGTRLEAFVLPESFDPEASQLALRLDPSLAAAMIEGLSYLEHFEYECTEQLVSRFLPNALTYRALRLLGIDDPELAAKLDEVIPEALAELARRQNGDGGWGWWADERSNPHLTAYATFALLRLAEMDVRIDEAMLDRALDYLEDQLLPADELTSTWEANRTAWVAYVLTLGRRASASDAVSDLLGEREKLSHYGIAYLMLAAVELGTFQAALPTLISDLVNDAILSATGAHWEESAIDWWAMNTDTRSTAIVLDALVRVDPENALLPNVVRWLMVARRAGIWETTQENAWALISLTDWMELTGELRGNYELRVGLDGEPLLFDVVTPETVRTPREVTLTGVDLVDASSHSLSIARDAGEGTLYYTAHWTVGLPVEEVEPLDRGVSITREYRQAGASEDAVEEVTALAVGEEIEVRLTITAPNDLYYVVVVDPIPAGCEAVDTSLATTSVLEPTPGLDRSDSPWGWWWHWFSRSEFRDDKVVLFVDVLSAGTYTYTYRLRAMTPGAFHVLPANASEFYFPEVFGRSDGRVLRVLEGD